MASPLYKGKGTVLPTVLYIYCRPRYETRVRRSAVFIGESNVTFSAMATDWKSFFLNSKSPDNYEENTNRIKTFVEHKQKNGQPIALVSVIYFYLNDMS